MVVHHQIIPQSKLCASLLQPKQPVIVVKGLAVPVLFIESTSEIKQ
jgi:hypothetical protein